ncbi:MAG: DUF1524 domain-containing protein, partial [Bacteroidota bacterium]
VGNNPWKLQKWHRKENNEYALNIFDDDNDQNNMVQLLSMFEVSFTARQRKNYLFYCMLYLFNHGANKGYVQFVSDLATKYFRDVYLISEKLNQINTPNPGSFDEALINDNMLNITLNNKNLNFTAIYGDGSEMSNGIPLFIFNYLDYKLWHKYATTLRGHKLKSNDSKRSRFFDMLGCSDFGLEIFDQFYFSRTRRSLEHFYPQAEAKGEGGKLNQDQINCLGNYAMIGSAANSSGSNWMPSTKLTHYLDASGKISQISVASLKFRIMMQKCKDNQDKRENSHEWDFEDIIEHQNIMVNILLSESP